MKTISNKRYRRTARRFIAIMLGIAALVALWLLRTPAEAVVWRVLEPVAAVRNAWLGSEAGRVRGELAAAEALVADRELLYQENLELKVRLGRDGAANVGHVVLAGVLQGPPGTPYDTLLIDAGAADGVAEGDLVSAGGRALVGRVSQAYARSARVMLFSSPGEAHQGFLVLSGNLNDSMPVSIVGQGGGSLVADVPATTEVIAGDAVVLPGVSGGFSALVRAVEREEGESSVRVYLTLSASPTALRYVEVWTNGER